MHSVKTLPCRNSPRGLTPVAVPQLGRDIQPPIESPRQSLELTEYLLLVSSLLVRKPPAWSLVLKAEPLQILRINQVAIPMSGAGGWVPGGGGQMSSPVAKLDTCHIVYSITDPPCKSQIQ